jgi:O-antigen biosynthesis protein WbqP
MRLNRLALVSLARGIAGWTLLPVLGVVALVVKLDSAGPVLFRQRRIGQYKQEFNVLKFRTMHTDAPSDMPTHMLQNASSHITRVGGFLRKSSLDELPQIFNILSGEMSFVGPRPALWNQDDLVAERDRYGANGLMPGLTGWAQVSGRDELPIPVKAEKDGWYAAHAGFFTDIHIVFRTFHNVLFAKGIVEGSVDGERR